MTDIFETEQVVDVERPQLEHAETNTLLHEIAELRAALRSVVEAWSGAYAGEMAVNRAIEKAEKLLHRQEMMDEHG